MHALVLLPPYRKVVEFFSDVSFVLIQASVSSKFTELTFTPCTFLKNMKSYNLTGLSRKLNILAASYQSNPSVDFIGKCLQGSSEMRKNI